MWKQYIRQGSVVGYVVALILALFVFLGPLWWGFALFEHFRVYIAIGCLVVLVAGTFHQFRWRALVLTGLALFLLLPLWPYYTADRDPAPSAHEMEFRAMLLNVHVSNTEREKVIDLVKMEKPDVLLLLEIDKTWADGLQALTREYPHGELQARPGAFGMWLLSKYPLVSTQVHTGNGDSHPVIQTNIDFGDRMLHFVGAHPVPPIGGRVAELHAHQVSDLAHRMVVVKKPKMLLGDFNATPWSSSFEKMASVTGLRDSAMGRGIDATWGHGNFPFLPLPIDHCLVCEQIKVVDRRVCRDVGSDHRGVVVDFALPPAPFDAPPPRAKPFREHDVLKVAEPTAIPAAEILD